MNCLNTSHTNNEIMKELEKDYSSPAVLNIDAVRESSSTISAVD